MPAMLSGTEAVFINETVCGLRVVLTFCGGNVKAPGDKAAVVCSSTANVLAPVTRSSRPSPLKSPAAIAAGSKLGLTKSCCGLKVPSPFPSSRETGLLTGGPQLGTVPQPATTDNA